MPPSSRATLVFATLTVLLTAGLFLQIRRTRQLEAALTEMTRQRARERGLAEGAALAPGTLLDPAGALVPLRFDDTVGTLLLFHAAGCGACTTTRPLWLSAVAEAARPDVRVLSVQTDGATERIDLEGLPPSLAVPLPPEGWLAALPAVPATLLVDSAGVLRRGWYGELDGPTRAELVRALAEL
jgi:hypothetical protein